MRYKINLCTVFYNWDRRNMILKVNLGRARENLCYLVFVISVLFIYLFLITRADEAPKLI